MREQTDCLGTEAEVAADVEVVLIDYLRENFLPHVGNQPVDPHQHLFDSGILDSAGVLSVILFIETRFGLFIPDDDLLPEHFSSIAAATKYITKRVKGSNASRSYKGEQDVEHQEVPYLGSR
jgi:acyl carrier protein